MPGDVLHGKLSANDEGMWAAGIELLQRCTTVAPLIRAPRSHVYSRSVAQQERTWLDARTNTIVLSQSSI